MQEEALLDIRKRPSRLQKGVSLISKYNYLYSHLPSSPILLAVFTPLSIRRGDGGEAVLHLQTAVFTPLSIRRGVGGEAFLHLQTAVFTPLSIRRGGGDEAVDRLGVRLVVSFDKASFYLFLTARDPVYRWLSSHTSSVPRAAQHVCFYASVPPSPLKRGCSEPSRAVPDRCYER